MPKSTQKKSSAKSTKITTKPKVEQKPKEVKQKTNFRDIFKFGESYTSLILGIIFVVIATIILLTFVKGKNANVNTEDTKQKVVSQKSVEPTSTPEITKKVLSDEQKNVTVAPTKPKPTEIKQDAKISGSTYIVKKDDTLWKIAENKYKSGYNWVDIQKANGLTNPGVLYAGTKLVLPNVQAKTATVMTSDSKGQTMISATQTNRISGASYTIVKGDTLWDISIRAYGDGYAWTKIAKANNLSSPGVIHPGNKLTIPRE
jgi:nucleoid-associated protein YgaU